ncbi:MAG: PAS domain-containing protein [Magnetospirillum sp.]|nr:PAS domain-containing protein [Magnetospirillum sp.]
MLSSEISKPTRSFRPVSGRCQANADVCAKIERFQSQWQAMADAKGRLPTRREFDPTAVPDLLPNLLLVEKTVVGDESESRHRVRLAGTRVVAAMGSEITGYDLATLPREDGARALAAGVDLCIAQRRPIPGEFTVVSGHAGWVARVGRIAGFRFLAVPFSETYTVPTVAMMLVLFVAADGSEVWAEWLGTSATA